MKEILLPVAGTYIIVIEVGARQKLEIGKIGMVNIERGYYFYVGSALGPGGVNARVSRHLKRIKTKHWHIDFLRNIGSVVTIVVSYSKKKKECKWASRLKASPCLSTPISGFGASDCACFSHLFFSKNNIDINLLRGILKE